MLDAKYAKQFDPTRPKEQLDKVLTWNGVEIDVAAKKAPRGCLGHDVAFDLAKKIVDHFLPGFFYLFDFYLFFG